MNILVEMLEVLHFTNIVDIIGQTLIVFISIFPYLFLFSVISVLINKLIKYLWK